MRKLSDYQNEEALDLLADIVDPASLIMGDAEVKAALKGENKLPRLTKAIIRNHKPELIEILARLDGVPVEEYRCNVFTLPIKVIEILNDKELLDFFSSAAEVEVPTSSIAAMEPIQVIDVK